MSDTSMKPANAHLLTINGGSSSLKFAMYEVGETLTRGLQGKVDRIGLSGTSLTFSDEIHPSAESVFARWHAQSPAGLCPMEEGRPGK